MMRLIETRMLLVGMLGAILTAGAVRADDWPEFRGKGRLGVWTETGIMDRFPAEGLKFDWRVPVHGGYAGPAVAQGRVFVTDFRFTEGKRGIERAVCLDEKTGKTLWQQEWEADYGNLSYNSGTRATPTVDGDRVYVLGSTGVLSCLKTETGEVVWRKEYLKDLGADLPIWGMSAAPLVEGESLICLCGGRPNGKVIAFNKLTGAELWRALDSDSEPGYVAPMVIEAGGTRQLIIWQPKAISSLNPKTGEVYWEQPFEIKMNAPLASPILDGSKLFVTAFYNGPMMLELDSTHPAAKLLWKGTSDNEIKTDGLHACHFTPVFKDGYIYGFCSYGQFRCLNAETGQRIWESFEPAVENKRWAGGHIIRHRNRFFINNDRGDLIICELEPVGFLELSRTHLIKPTTGGAGRRDLDFVAWSPPAYANKHIVARNDEEIVRASLEAGVKAGK